MSIGTCIKFLQTLLNQITMRLFKTLNRIAVEKENNYYLINDNWDGFINDENLFTKVLNLLPSLVPKESSVIGDILPPIGSQQELWACGVTYLRSKIGRQEESKETGGADFMVRYMKPSDQNVFSKVTRTELWGITILSGSEKTAHGMFLRLS